MAGPPGAWNHPDDLTGPQVLYPAAPLALQPRLVGKLYPPGAGLRADDDLVAAHAVNRAAEYLGVVAAHGRADRRAGGGTGVPRLVPRL